MQSSIHGQNNTNMWDANRSVKEDVGYITEFQLPLEWNEVSNREDC